LADVAHGVEWPAWLRVARSEHEPPSRESQQSAPQERQMIWLIVSVVIFVAWFCAVLEVVIGMRKVPLLADLPDMEPGESCPRLSVVIPARNEEGFVGAALQSLLKQEYPELEVIVVDDRSTDATGLVAESVAARSGGVMRVEHVTDLPDGWLGKCHAMALGAACSRGDYILFTDADIVFEPGVLRRTVAYLVRENADMLVVPPDMITHSFGERAVIATFITSFLLGFPPWRAISDGSRTFVGVGAFNMVRRSFYESIGGHDSLRMNVVDDVALGKLVKRSGGRVRVAVGNPMIRVRWYESVGAIIRGLEKNAFAAMSYSVLRTVGAVAGTLGFYWWPVVGLFVGPWPGRSLCAAVLLLIQPVGRVAARRITSVHPFYSFAYPLGSLAICWILLRSAFLTLRQGGIRWRDSFYPIGELRKHRL
jgi:glycosyltransferase involved in cell wall biosynthesis